MSGAVSVARSVVIRVPMAPPAELSPNARRRGNVWAQREATETLRTAAYWATKRHFSLDQGSQVLVMEPFETVVTIHEHIIWPKGRRLIDPDGLASMCKAALDGIVDAEIIAGDSAKHVASVTASQEKGQDMTGAIVFTIREVS